MKSPTAKMLPLIVNLIAEKSGLPTIAARKGVNRSLVKAPTTLANAAPITTPTAMSTTLPRRMNCLKPLSMIVLLGTLSSAAIERLGCEVGFDQSPPLLLLLQRGIRSHGTA